MKKLKELPGLVETFHVLRQTSTGHKALLSLLVKLYSHDRADVSRDPRCSDVSGTHSAPRHYGC